ncbi:MAG: hypothetical protein RLN87_03470, partial [Parasphingopyxis sp.]|uniref:hypothetical protein n=2 Tax=Parasphingopyxis TaxID=1234545 RepID=UPI0032EF5069
SGGYMSVSDDGMWLLPYGKRVIGWSEISTIRAKKYYHRGMYMGTNLCVDFVCPDDFVEKNVFGSRFGSKGWARANRFLGGADFEMDFGTFEASREEIMAAIHSSSNGQFGEPATTSAQADI